MRLVTVCVPGADPRPLLAAYRRHLEGTGRGNTAYWQAASGFFSRWPDPATWAAEPLEVQLAASPSARPLITFLLLHGHLRPGYRTCWNASSRACGGNWTVPRSARTWPVSWTRPGNWGSASATGSPPRPRPPPGCSSSPAGPWTSSRWRTWTSSRQRAVTASSAPGRASTTTRWRCSTRTRVLFHLQILPGPPGRAAAPATLASRMTGITPAIADALTAYLTLKKATCTAKTVSSLASRLMHFGRFLTETDPGLDTLAGLDRQRHIEPYLASVAEAPSSKKDAVITPGEQQRRVLAAAGLLTDITAWGWEQAPGCLLIFPGDIPRLPKVLPRYLPVDAGRRLGDALRASPNQQQPLPVRPRIQAHRSNLPAAARDYRDGHAVLLATDSWMPMARHRQMVR
jgi:hypothetical protein